MADSVIVQEAAMDTFDPLLCQKGTDVWPARRSRMLAVVAGTLLITAVATFGILVTYVSVECVSSLPLVYHYNFYFLWIPVTHGRMTRG
jgi:hypothetical protein